MSGRVPGHTLRSEGAPYTPDGYRWGLRGGGPGCARCSCGAMSPVLPSRGKRKAWHRQHKADVLTGGDA